MKEIVDLLTIYVLPIVALFLSIVFYLLGRDSANRAEYVLGEIGKAAQTWQSEIMSAATSILNSSPEITGTKIYLAKIEAANKLSDAIVALVNDMGAHPKQGDEAAAQARNLKLLLDYQFHQFNTVLDGRPLPGSGTGGPPPHSAPSTQSAPSQQAGASAQPPASSKDERDVS